MIAFLDTLRALDAAATPEPLHIGQPTIMRPTHTLYSKPFGMGDVAEVHKEPDAALLVFLRNAAPRIAALIEKADRVARYFDPDDGGQGTMEEDGRNLLKALSELDSK